MQPNRVIAELQADLADLRRQIEAGNSQVLGRLTQLKELAYQEFDNARRTSRQHPETALRGSRAATVALQAAKRIVAEDNGSAPTILRALEAALNAAQQAAEAED